MTGSWLDSPAAAIAAERKKWPKHATPGHLPGTLTYVGQLSDLPRGWRAIDFSPVFRAWAVAPSWYAPVLLIWRSVSIDLRFGVARRLLAGGSHRWSQALICCCTRHVGPGKLCPVCPLHGVPPLDDDNLRKPNQPPDDPDGARA